MKKPRCPRCGEELGNPMTSFEVPGEIPFGKVRWVCSECPDFRAFQYLPWTEEFERYRNAKPGSPVVGLIIASILVITLLVTGFLVVRWLV